MSNRLIGHIFWGLGTGSFIFALDLPPLRFFAFMFGMAFVLLATKAWDADE